MLLILFYLKWITNKVELFLTCKWVKFFYYMYIFSIRLWTLECFDFNMQLIEWVFLFSNYYLKLLIIPHLIYNLLRGKKIKKKNMVVCIEEIEKSLLIIYQFWSTIFCVIKSIFWVPNYFLKLLSSLIN